MISCGSLLGINRADRADRNRFYARESPIKLPIGSCCRLDDRPSSSSDSKIGAMQSTRKMIHWATRGMWGGGVARRTMRTSRVVRITIISRRASRRVTRRWRVTAGGAGGGGGGGGGVSHSVASGFPTLLAIIPQIIKETLRAPDRILSLSLSTGDHRGVNRPPRPLFSHASPTPAPSKYFSMNTECSGGGISILPR